MTKEDKFVLRLTESIKGAINEELGISDEVTEALHTIIEELKNDYKRSFAVPTHIRGVKRRFGAFEVNVFGEKLIVNWECYDYQNLDRLDDYPINTFGHYIKKSDKQSQQALIIKLLSLSGKLNYHSMYETIRHELHHFYEDVKRGFKRLPKMDLYNYATRLLHKYPEYDIRHMIGEILYISFDFEQRAFYNGTYEFLKSNIDVAYNFNLKIQQTPMFSHLLYLNTCIDELKSIGEENWTENELTWDVADILKCDYKITYNKLLKMARKTVKDLSLGIGKAIIKAKDDYNGEYYVTFER